MNKEPQQQKLKQAIKSNQEERQGELRDQAYREDR